MEKNKLDKKETLVLFGGLAVFYAVTMLIPGFSLLGILFMISFVCLIGIRVSMGAAAVSSVAVLGVNTLLSFLLQAGMEMVFSPVVFVTVFVSLVLAWCIRAKVSCPKMIVLSTIAVMVGVILPIFLLNRFFIPTYILSLKKELASYLYEAIDAVSQSINLKSASIEQFKAQYLTLIKLVMPGILIVMSSGISFACLWIVRFYCRRLKDNSCEYIPSFTALLSDRVTPVVFIVSFVLSMFMSNQMMMVFLNLAIITGAVMFVFGFSLVSYYIQKIFKKTIARVISYIVIFCIPSIGFVLVILGVLDTFLNFRHLQSRGDKIE